MKAPNKSQFFFNIAIICFRKWGYITREEAKRTVVHKMQSLVRAPSKSSFEHQIALWGVYKPLEVLEIHLKKSIFYDHHIIWDDHKIRRDRHQEFDALILQKTFTLFQMLENVSSRNQSHQKLLGPIFTIRDAHHYPCFLASIGSM